MTCYVKTVLLHTIHFFSFPENLRQHLKCYNEAFQALIFGGTWYQHHSVKHLLKRSLFVPLLNDTNINRYRYEQHLSTDALRSYRIRLKFGNENNRQFVQRRIHSSVSMVHINVSLQNCRTSFNIRLSFISNSQMCAPHLKAHQNKNKKKNKWMDGVYFARNQTRSSIMKQFSSKPGNKRNNLCLIHLKCKIKHLRISIQL